VPTTYPATWVSRVQCAPKLAPNPATGAFHSPDASIAVAAEAIATRTEAYLKAEAARRKRKLSKEDEKVCREFVVLVDNWRTGAWLSQPPARKARR
jgi:hypothetical protein